MKNGNILTTCPSKVFNKTTLLGISWGYRHNTVGVLIEFVMISKKNWGKRRECIHNIGGFLDRIIKDNGST